MGTSVKLVLPSLQQPGFEGDDEEDDGDYNDGGGAGGDGTIIYRCI